MGPLKNSDGSAEWHVGKTPHTMKLVCSVNGPLEAKTRDELPQQATLELVYRRNKGLPMLRERFIQEKLHTCLLAMLRRDTLPRSLVQVVVQLLEGDISVEAEISEGVNVMTLALIDAGIPMSGIVTGVSYGITKENEIVKLTEEHKQRIDDFESLHAVAYKYTGDESPKLIMAESTGQFSKEQAYKVLNIAQKDTAEVTEHIRTRTEH